MVNLYMRLIQKGLRTLDSVPKALREKVREMLLEAGMEELAAEECVIEAQKEVK